ncbi:MAG: 6-bladed beta-propeller [Chloroflexi bacterium]|nr:6-bladed beta-propeller [Chloroflexota bacterium]
MIVGVTYLPWMPKPQEAPYTLVKTWGGKGEKPGQFNEPTGIALAGNEVFVSDSRNTRIQVFDLEGNFKRLIGEKGEAPGQLNRPMNLTIAGGELYVAEFFNDRIQVYGLDGEFRRSIGKAGSAGGEMSAPGGVAVDADGVLKADLLADAVHIAELEQVQANDGLHPAHAAQAGGPYGAGLAVGEEELYSIGGNAAGLGQLSSPQRPVGDGLPSGPGKGSNHAVIQVHGPKLVDAGHGDVDHPLVIQQVVWRT